MEKVKVTFEDVETGKKATVNITETNDGLDLDINFGGEPLSKVKEEENLKNALLGAFLEALSEGAEITQRD